VYSEQEHIQKAKEREETTKFKHSFKVALRSGCNDLARPLSVEVSKY